MSNASKVGISTAGGTISGPGASNVLVEGAPQVLIGDSVVPHGTPPHDNAHMVQGSTLVLVEGKPPCRNGDLASCGDAASNGAATVMIGG